MGAKTERIERRSQATPLAEDVLAMLRGQMAAGQFGLGVGPLQREAGTSARQFVQSLQGRTGRDAIDPTELLRAIETRSRRSTNEGAAQLREQFGAAGARFGSQVARGEGEFRARRGEALDETTARTILGAEQFNAQHRGQMEQLLLQGISTLHGMGQGNIAPFLQMASLGIIPEEIVQKPSVLGQVLGGILDLGKTAFDIAGPEILDWLGGGGIPDAPPPIAPPPPPSDIPPIAGGSTIFDMPPPPIISTAPAPSFPGF